LTYSREFSKICRIPEFRVAVLEIPLSSRAKKYQDKIRSAEGTDPIFYIFTSTGSNGSTATIDYFY